MAGKRNFTVAAIKQKIRDAAPRISRQYSALWPEFVSDELNRIERNAGERMSDSVFDSMHDYGMAQVRKHGLPSKNPSWISATAVRIVKRGRKSVLQIKTRRRAR